MTQCQTCAFIEEKGYSPPGVFHCSGTDGCHRSWKSHAECHCATCHRSFGGDEAFQAHIVGDVCRDPAQLKTKAGVPRFRPIEREGGFVWVSVRPETPRARRGGVRALTARSTPRSEARRGTQ